LAAPVFGHRSTPPGSANNPPIRSMQSVLTSFGMLPGALRRERVLVAAALIVAALALADRAQSWASIRFVADSLVGIAPFFALAVVFAGYARASGLERIIAGVFDGKRGRSVVIAGLVGALSPFCSCGVIPLIASMLRAGVPLAPVLAFCIASPIMDPEMFILTAAGISLPFAVAKTVAAIGMGLLAGFIVLQLARFQWINQPLRADWRGGCSDGDNGCGDGDGDNSCAPSTTQDKVVHAFWREQQRRAWFVEEVAANGAFLSRWLIFAFLLESLMVAYIPSGWVSQWVGEGSAFAVPLAALIGLPSYLNGYAAIPLVAGLIDIGMSGGAAMAFITTGAVSSIPAAIAVFALVRRPVFALYVVLGFAGALLSGYLYGAWLAW